MNWKEEKGLNIICIKITLQNEGQLLPPTPNLTAFLLVFMQLINVHKITHILFYYIFSPTHISDVYKLKFQIFP